MLSLRWLTYLGENHLGLLFPLLLAGILVGAMGPSASIDIFEVIYFIWFLLTLIYLSHLLRAICVQIRNRLKIGNIYRHAIRFDLLCGALGVSNEYFTFKKFTDFSFTEAQRTEMRSKGIQAQLTQLQQIKGSINGGEVEVMFYSGEFKKHLNHVWYSIIYQLFFIISLCYYSLYAFSFNSFQCHSTGNCCKVKETSDICLNFLN